MGKEQIIVQLNPDVPHTGSDLGVVNAARRSFGKRSEWEYCGGDWCDDLCNDSDGSKSKCPKLKDKDKRLLEFLARGMTADDFDAFVETVSLRNMDAYGYAGQGNNEKELKELLWQWRNTATHDTPFNHGFFSFEVKLPMFSARQLVKTEYTIISEISRRYITDDIEFYEHTYRNQSEDKKQGSVGRHGNSGKWEALSREHAMQAVTLYNKMVEDGVAIEQARGELPANLMVEWTWSGTLGAFAKMCRERLASDAQQETRLVAQKVYEELKKQFPVAAPLLVEGVK